MYETGIYLKVCLDALALHTGATQDTFALSLSKGNSPPTHGVLS